MNGRCAARRAFALLTSLALLGGAEGAGAEESHSNDTSHMRTGLVAAGAVTLGIGHVGSIYVAAESGSPYSDGYFGWSPLGSDCQRTRLRPRSERLRRTFAELWGTGRISNTPMPS